MDTLSPRVPRYKHHYTYVLKYPDDYPELEKAGTVFYVGKGTRSDRIDYHEYEAKRGDRNYKCNVIRLIWSHGKQVVKEKIAFFDMNEEACMHEIALIFFMDGLTNISTGGESGSLGVVPSEATRLKMSKSRKGRKLSEYAIQRLIESNIGRKASEATIRKLSESHMGIKPSEATLRKRSETMKAKTISEASLRNLCAPPGMLWRGFVAPDGTRYENVVNLRAFCREHGLQVSSMHKVAHGKRPHHKGWKAIPE